MPNRQYEQGTRFELKVIKDLASRGYVTVRAAGSKGAGKVDVIACLDPHLVSGVLDSTLGPVISYASTGERYVLGHLWIQCKRTGSIGPGEWNQLRRCASWAGAVPVLAQNAQNGRGVVYLRLDADKVPRSHTRPYSVYDVGPVRVQETA